MSEGPLFKTKLCKLYRRGDCNRQKCNFAHGTAELRRLPGPLTGRQDHRGGDLRDKLKRRHSPYRRYSPGREGRGRHVFHGQRQLSHDRGHSPSRSPVKRRHEKRQQVDGHSDATSPGTSDDDEDRLKEGKLSSYDEKDALEEKLKDTRLDIENLDENKCQLENILKEKMQEENELSTKIEELESQLNKEREDCRRMTSKNKKFIKALGHYLRAQEELKRSQTRLQRLADQLGSDTLKSGANEEDSSVNILSDGEPNLIGSRHDLHNHASPVKKRSRLSLGTSEETKPGSSKILDRFLDLPTRPERHIIQSENSKKGIDAANKVMVKNDIHKFLAGDHNQRIGKNSSFGTASEKVKGSELGTSLLMTSMAAQEVDELIEAIEMDEKSEGVEATVASQNGAVEAKSGLPFPLPPAPKVASNMYNQYKGDDEDVDVEGVEIDMRDVDLNSEVEIEN